LTARAGCTGFKSAHTRRLTQSCTRYSWLVKRSLHFLTMELRMVTFGDALQVK
jgi:hypothetical protein